MAEGQLVQAESSEQRAVAQAGRPAPVVSFGKGRGLEPTDLEGAWRCAVYVSKSGLAPKGIQTPEAILIAAAMGSEIGLSFMQSLQSIAVINGRPSVWGDAALALVRSSGLCAEFREWTDGQGDAMTAHAYGRRQGEEKGQEEFFSVEDAKRAGLWNKEGPWRNYPRRMLAMRARGFLLRNLWPDVLKGTITAEEASDLPTFAPTGPGTPFQVEEVGTASQPEPSMPAQKKTPEEQDAAGGGNGASPAQGEEKQKRHRATKAEMEARRAAEVAPAPTEPAEPPASSEPMPAMGEIVRTKHGEGTVIGYGDGNAERGPQVFVEMDEGSKFPGQRIYAYVGELAQAPSSGQTENGQYLRCPDDKPTGGDQMDPLYCSAQCRDAEDCSAFEDYQKSTAPRAKPATRSLF